MLCQCHSYISDLSLLLLYGHTYMDIGFFLVIKWKAFYSLFRYVHPIDNRECPVVIGGDYITTESGTGLVHTAPGHGQEDYVTGLKYGLPIRSPVDDDGKFTVEAGEFSGLDVLGNGNAAVIQYLDNHSLMLMVEPYSKFYGTSCISRQGISVLVDIFEVGYWALIS